MISSNGEPVVGTLYLRDSNGEMSRCNIVVRSVEQLDEASFVTVIVVETTTPATWVKRAGKQG